MPLKDDTRTLKRKVDSILTNIKIYQRDIDDSIRKLRKYGIDSEDDIDDLLEELDESVDRIEKKKQVLLKRASKLLKGINPDD